MNLNVKLSYEELQIIVQCIKQLNFSGQNVKHVGLLIDKLEKSIVKIEQKNKVE